MLGKNIKIKKNGKREGTYDKKRKKTKGLK